MHIADPLHAETDLFCAIHSLQPDETAETLERSMREIHPGVSQAYIDLLKDYFDLK